jgi:hypothetical protein
LQAFYFVFFLQLSNICSSMRFGRACTRLVHPLGATASMVAYLPALRNRQCNEGQCKKLRARLRSPGASPWTSSFGSNEARQYLLALMDAVKSSATMSFCMLTPVELQILRQLLLNQLASCWNKDIELFLVGLSNHLLDIAGFVLKLRSYHAATADSSQQTSM